MLGNWATVEDETRNWGSLGWPAGFTNPDRRHGESRFHENTANRHIVAKLDPKLILVDGYQRIM